MYNSQRSINSEVEILLTSGINSNSEKFEQTKLPIATDSTHLAILKSLYKRNE